MVTERGKELLRGIERADSIGLDAHKWFFQPYEAGGLLVKDVGTLERAFGVHHDILQDTIWGGNYPNFSDRGLQLSRACRALKIWDVGADLRHGGVPAGGVQRDGVGGPGPRNTSRRARCWSC